MICIECGKDVLADYQTIKTQRGTLIHICDSCVKKNKRKEGDNANNADNSKRSI